MSIKIYNGYRLTPDTDLDTFIAHTMAALAPVRSRLDAERLMGTAVHLVDAADIESRTRPTDPLSEAVATESPEQFVVSFAIDDATGQTVAIVHTDSKELTDAWEALDPVEKFGYWNTADRPEGVSRAEWAERRSLWRRVTASRTRLSPRLNLPAATAAEISAEALRAAAPSVACRARRLAVELLLDAETARGASRKQIVRLVLGKPANRAAYDGVVTAVAAALNDDAVDFVIFPAAGIARGLRTEAIHTATSAYLAG